MRIVIIGGGIAGTTAAEELRKHNKECEITLISEEQHPVYSRVLLANYLIGKTEREKLFLKKESWYQDQNIEWMRGEVVTDINIKNQFVAISNGREIPYDKLLITTGAQPRLLDDDMRGVVYLRTIDDADQLLQLINEQENHKAVIYGGGFIASEYLNTFAHYNINTTIAFRGPWFWSRVLDEQSGEMLNEHLKEKGVTVVSNAVFDQLLGEEECKGIATSQGKIEGSLIGIGIGTAPDLSLLKEKGIEIASGIRVNEKMETNLPDIYAAGDMVEYDDMLLETPLVARTWMNATLQGRVAAQNMLDQEKVFSVVSTYAMNILGLDVVFVGDTTRSHADTILVEGNKEKGITQIFLKDDRVIGGTMMGRNKDRVKVMKCIQEKSGWEA